MGSNFSREKQEGPEGSVDPSERNDPKQSVVPGLLPEDTYSLLAFASSPLTLVVCSVTTLVQCTTLGVLLFDAIDLDGGNAKEARGFIPENPLDIPPAISIEVVLSQFLAILITLISESNVLWSFNVFLNGYHRDLILRLLDEDDTNDTLEVESFVRSRGTADASPMDVLKVRWFVSNSLRMTVGCLSLVATFVLIVRSEDVVDVLLNFTAIEFISRIDNTVFTLVKWGYFGDTALGETRRPIINERGFTILFHFVFRYEAFWSFFWNAFLRVAILLLFIASWSIVVSRQNRGVYFPKALYLQVGDSVDLRLATYSGVYFISDHADVNTRRFSYSSETGGRLFYCEATKSWVFTSPTAPFEKLESNSCGWVLKSAETEEYDVLDTITEPWFLLEEFNIDTPVEHLLLVTHNPSFGRSCTGKNRYGYNCEFESVCDKLALDARFNPQLNPVNSLSGVFDRLPGIQLYGRPVFIGSAENSVFIVLQFAGRRWIASSTLAWRLSDGRRVDSVVDVVQYLKENPFSFSVERGVQAVSDPVDVGTLLGRSPVPTGLNWYPFGIPNAEANRAGRLVARVEDPYNVRLQCAICTADSDCQFAGKCIEGTCHCEVGAKGSRCEVSPFTNGLCNDGVNTPAENFDGGDCCLSTCVNSKFVCGRDAVGLNDMRNAFCKDQIVAEWPPNNIALGLQSRGGSFGESVVMSYSGDSFAVGAPFGDGLVQLHDRDGSEIIQRGTALQTFFDDENFGYELLYAGRIPSAVSNRLVLAPMHVIGFGNGNGASFMYPFYCSNTGCFQTTVEMDRGEYEGGNSTFDVVEDFFSLHLLGERTAGFNPISGAYLQPISSIPVGFPVTMDGQDIIYPAASTLSPDGRFLLTTNADMRLHEWHVDDGLWRQVFGTYVFPRDDSSGDFLPLYFSLSSPIVDADNVTELLVLVGSQRWDENMTNSDAIVRGAPLDVQMFRWVEGFPPEELGSQIRSDFHLIDLRELDFIDNRDVDTVTRLPEKSLQLSSDGRVMTVSSWFATTGSQPSGLVMMDEEEIAPSMDEFDFLQSLRGQVHVYEWDSGRADWSLRQIFDLGEKSSPHIREGWKTSLSSDGSVLAIGTAKSVDVYHWNVNVTVYLSVATFDGDSDLSLSLSGDGSALAIGYPFRNDRGAVQLYTNDLYEYCSPELEGYELRLSLTIGDSEGRTQWSVQKSRSGSVIHEDGPFFANRIEPSEFVKEMTFLYRECFFECTSFSISTTMPTNLDRVGTVQAVFNKAAVPRKEEMSGEADCEIIVVW